jgi:hypothetical protein
MNHFGVLKQKLYVMHPVEQEHILEKIQDHE